MRGKILDIKMAATLLILKVSIFNQPRTSLPLPARRRARVGVCVGLGVRVVGFLGDVIDEVIVRLVLARVHRLWRIRTKDIDRSVRARRGRWRVERKAANSVLVEEVLHKGR